MQERSRIVNILVSSTRQWNPGDEFILLGVRNLLEAKLRGPSNWLLWNRNPDLFVRNWEDPRLRIDFLTNSLRSPCLDLVDLVVLAGTPEWHGKPLEPVYRELLRYPHVPLLALGIGSGSAELNLQVYELEVLQRPNTLITTRSKELAASLNDSLGTPKAVALPCPAIFCADRETACPTPRDPGNIVGIVIQSSTVVNQSISEELVKELLTAIEKQSGQALELVCLYIDEFMRFARTGYRNATFYSFSPRDYLKQLCKYKAVVSTRLHGALAALSVGVPTVLVAKDNVRIESAAKLYENVMASLAPREALSWASALKLRESKDLRDGILSFKRSCWENYSELLSNFLASCDLI